MFRTITEGFKVAYSTKSDAILEMHWVLAVLFFIAIIMILLSFITLEYTNELLRAILVFGSPLLIFYHIMWYKSLK